MANIKGYLGDLKGDSKIHEATIKSRQPTSLSQELLQQARQDTLLVGEYSTGLINVRSRAKFINYFFPAYPRKHELDVFRSFWLGTTVLSCPTFESEEQLFTFISNKLVEDIVERVGSYRLNFDKIPYTQRRQAQLKHKFHKVRLYRDWFHRNFGKSTYVSKVIPLIAEGASIERIREVVPVDRNVSLLNGRFEAPIITSDELDKIYSILEEKGDSFIPKELQRIEQLNKSYSSLKNSFIPKELQPIEQLDEIYSFLKNSFIPEELQRIEQLDKIHSSLKKKPFVPNKLQPIEQIEQLERLKEIHSFFKNSFVPEKLQRIERLNKIYSFLQKNPFVPNKLQPIEQIEQIEQLDKMHSFFKNSIVPKELQRIEQLLCIKSLEDLNALRASSQEDPFVPIEQLDEIYSFLQNSIVPKELQPIEQDEKNNGEASN